MTLPTSIKIPKTKVPEKAGCLQFGLWIDEVTGRICAFEASAECPKPRRQPARNQSNQQSAQ